MNFDFLKSGSSVEDSEIVAFKNDFKGNKYLYLMAGVHGDEVEGVFVLQKLFEWLKTVEENQINIPIIVIPILNVDGYKHGIRQNAHGVDLNRNLPTSDWSRDYSEKKYYPGTAPLSEPENKFLDKLFKKYPPTFIMSFHSWKPLININGDCMKVAEFLKLYNKYEIVDDIGYPTPGSLGTYGSKNLKCPVITFEFPLLNSDLLLKDIWAENEEGLSALFFNEDFLNIFK